MQSVNLVSRIPILKLPFVVFKSLIQHFDPYEIISLSSLSYRFKSFIKCSIRKNKYKLGVHFVVYPKITLTLGEDECCFNFTRSPVYDCKLLPLDETVINAIKSRATNLSSTFNSDIDCLTIFTDGCIGQVPSIVDWINEKQPSINCCKCHGSKADNQDVLYFIENCKVKYQLALGFDFLEGSRSPLIPRFDTDIIILSERAKTPWFTLEDVSNINSIEIQMAIFGSISKKDMNNFIKRWIQGCNSRMKYFSAYVPYFETGAVFEGIHVEKKEESLVRHYELKRGGLFVLKGGNDIKNENGQLATVHQEPKHFVNNRGETFTRNLGEFTMIVWN